MSLILRFILLVALIAAVSAGVYYWFEERESGIEKAVEETDETIDGMQEQTRPEQGT